MSKRAPLHNFTAEELEGHAADTVRFAKEFYEAIAAAGDAVIAKHQAMHPASITVGTFDGLALLLASTLCTGGTIEQHHIRAALNQVGNRTLEAIAYFKAKPRQ